MSETLTPFIQVDASSTSRSASTSSSMQSSSDSSHQHRQANLVLACMIAISLCCNAVLGCVAVLSWKHGSDEHSATQVTPAQVRQSWRSGTGSVCFTCDYLGPGIKSNDTIYDVIRLPSSNTLCCLRKGNVVAALFQQIISDEFGHLHEAIQPMYFRLQRNTPTGAHLYIKPQGDFAPSWTSYDSYGTAFCSDVECQKGAITIKEGGRYLVYSHITLQNHAGFQLNKNLLHDIKRKNPNLAGLGEKLLLFSKTSTTASSRRTSFLSAILQLRSEDTLRTTISEDFYRLLDYGRFSNYFGVIKL